MASWFSIARACSLLAVLPAALLLDGCRSRQLPLYSTVSQFQLTAQDGTSFNSQSLQGSVWIAEFFFTNCTGPCPRMNSRLRHIEKTFAGQNDLKIVSMTVDPARDTPAVLAAYARKFSAEPGRWFFLTGPLAELNRLCRNVFLLGDITGDLNHSTRFVLVDRQSRIRGFYQSNDSDSMKQLISDIRLLLKERA
jgi:protein SCO1/2